MSQFKILKILVIISIVGIFCCSVSIFAKNVNDNRIFFMDNDEKIDLSNINLENRRAEGNAYTDFSGKYNTDIKYDNFYEAQKIKNNEEAKELIIKDSIQQKSNNYDEELSKIENNIINNYKVMAVNIEGMDIEVAQELESVVGYIYNKYPTAREYLTNITLINADANDDYIAIFMGMSPFADTVNYDRVNKTLIGLNSKYFLNKDMLINTTLESAAVGHFPQNASGCSTIAHEFGHFLSFLASLDKNNVDNLLLVKNKDYQKVFDLANDWNEGKTSLEIVEEAYANYKRKYGDSKSLLEFRESISNYAIAKDSSGNYLYDETIAEAFHDYYLNGENSVLASREIVDVLEKRISQL